MLIHTGPQSLIQLVVVDLIEADLAFLRSQIREKNSSSEIYKIREKYAARIRHTIVKSEYLSKDTFPTA